MGFVVPQATSIAEIYLALFVFRKDTICGREQDNSLQQTQLVAEGKNLVAEALNKKKESD